MIYRAIRYVSGLIYIVGALAVLGFLACGAAVFVRIGFFCETRFDRLEKHIDMLLKKYRDGALK